MPSGVVNLWQGWPVGLAGGPTFNIGPYMSTYANSELDGPEDPTYCKRWMHHLRYNVCGGNEDTLKYLLNWNDRPLAPRPNIHSACARWWAGLRKDLHDRALHGVFRAARHDLRR